MIEASIIIPTYNRVEKLRDCLESLWPQAQAGVDFDVVVVVDGSTDGTLDMLAGLHSPFGLRVIAQPNRGQPAALNCGAQQAAGRICIFLDDDMQVTPRFLIEHLRLHRSNERAVGVGQITLSLPPEADWFARLFAQVWRSHYAELNEGPRHPDWEDCYGGNMSVSRLAFLDVGGNAEDLKRGYDIELAYRLEQHGCSIEYIQDAIANQRESKSFRELSADAGLAGEASVELSRRHPPMLPKLLGKYRENSPASIHLWRLFWSAYLSVESLERLRRFSGKRTETLRWYRFFYNYSFWKGVRRAVSNRDEWKRITSNG